MLLPNAPSARSIDATVEGCEVRESASAQSMNDGTQARKRRLLAKFGEMFEWSYLRAKGGLYEDFIKRWGRRILTFTMRNETPRLMSGEVESLTTFAVVR
ncbi:MAG: hypothetical protein ACTS47_01950 [Candidatus Hodgkinia cicadicola]